jgi:hypothetical protein
MKNFQGGAVIKNESQLNAANRFRNEIFSKPLSKDESFDESVKYAPELNKPCNFFDGKSFYAFTGNYEAGAPVQWIYPIQEFSSDL